MRRVDRLSRPAKRLQHTESDPVGAWTALGIVKRLDDQKRLIDRMHRELEDLKATKRSGDTEGPEPEKIAQLADALETALTINKRLADSVIRIHDRLYEVVQQNKKLRIDVDLLRSKGSMTRGEAGALSRAALGVVKAVAAGPKSSTEISRTIERSREHTSRTVNQLVNLGLLQRAEKTFPPKYVLTESGRKLLNSEPKSTSE